VLRGRKALGGWAKKAERIRRELHDSRVTDGKTSIFAEVSRLDGRKAEIAEALVDEFDPLKDSAGPSSSTSDHLKAIFKDQEIPPWVEGAKIPLSDATLQYFAKSPLRKVAEPKKKEPEPVVKSDEPKRPRGRWDSDSDDEPVVVVRRSRPKPDSIKRAT
jgi:hypothetical protein